MLRHAPLHGLNRNALFLLRQDVLEHVLSQWQGESSTHKLGVGEHAGQGTLQLTDVGADTARDVLGHVRGQEGILRLGLTHQNGNFGFQVGRLDISDQAPLEA